MAEALTPEQLRQMGVPEDQIAVAPTPAPVQASAPTAEPKPTDALKRPAGSAWEFDLSDGRRVVLQDPGKALNLKVASLLGNEAGNPVLTTYFKAAQYVKQINGVPMPAITTRKDAEDILGMLGDDGMDEVANEVFYAKIERLLDKEAAKK